MAHDVRRRHDRAVDEIIREVEHSPDERAVADEYLVAECAGISRRALDDEPAFRADGNDHRILLGLGLHQPEDLGAEVVASIRPPDPSTRDITTAQVHGFDTRRVHPDLVHRARPGKKRELGGIQLDRERVAALSVRVRAHCGSDDFDERAQDAILVEALHRVDLAHEVTTGSFDAPRAFRIRQGDVEARLEEIDDSACGRRIGREGVRERRFGEPHPGLVQILDQRAQHHDLARRESGPEHETIEPVVLDLARPDPRNSSDTRACASGSASASPEAARTPNE